MTTVNKLQLASINANYKNGILHKDSDNYRQVLNTKPVIYVGGDLDKDNPTDTFETYTLIVTDCNLKKDAIQLSIVTPASFTIGQKLNKILQVLKIAMSSPNWHIKGKMDFTIENENGAKASTRAALLGGVKYSLFKPTMKRNGKESLAEFEQRKANNWRTACNALSQQIAQSLAGIMLVNGEDILNDDSIRLLNDANKVEAV